MSKKSLPLEERKVKFSISVSPIIYDGIKNISNKSKLIETLLEKYLKNEN